jgi:hypothetical protein
MSRRRHPLGAIACLAAISGLLCAAPGATAQPAPATWNEQVGWSNDFDSGLDYGPVDAEAEPISIQAGGPLWNAESHVTFRSPGPPQAALASAVHHATSELEGVMTGGQVSITYEFEIVETGSPPPGIIWIPFRVRSEGSVSVTPDDSWGSAHAIFDLVSTEHAGIYFAEIFEVSDGNPVSDSFSVDHDVNGELGEIFHVNLLLQTEVSTLNPILIASGEAAAEVETISFTISDNEIQGTGETYRDHYEILFCDGYWELGEPAANHRMSWGRVKALYGR